MLDAVQVLFIAVNNEVQVEVELNDGVFVAVHGFLSSCGA